MSGEAELRERLRKIEALFAGAGTVGEKLAAEAALERVRGSAPGLPNSRVETSSSRCRSRSATRGAGSSFSPYAAATASSPTGSIASGERL